MASKGSRKARTTTTRSPAAATSPESSTDTVSAERVLAFWATRQGLGREKFSSCAEALDSAGWMPTAGGAGPNLALKSRLAGEASRIGIERALVDRSIVDLPAMRGGTMLVPDADLEIALASARRFLDQAMAKAPALPEGEARALRLAILRALDNGPLSAAGLKEAVPAHLVREAGKEASAIGCSTTLALVLKGLHVDREVRRYTASGRLDRTDYLYERLRGRKVREWKDETLDLELARRFFRWAGPATVEDFATWAGITRAAARKAMDAEALFCVHVADDVAGDGSSEGWARLEDLEAIQSAEIDPSAVSLLPFRDNLFGFHRGVGRFVLPADRKMAILDWNHAPAPVGSQASLHHHAILVGGRLAGIWEWDGERHTVVTGLFSEVSKKAGLALGSLSIRLALAIKQELGDLRFYPLDAKGRVPRLAAVRRLR